MRVFEGNVDVEEEGTPRESAYRLPVIYFSKFENYTAFNTSPVPRSPSRPSPTLSLPPCFIHVAINKEQRSSL